MLKRCSKQIALIHLTIFVATLPISVWAAQSQKPILEMIPQDVSAFVVLSDLDQADKAVMTLADKTQLPIPGPIMILKMSTGLGNAIDTQGSMAALYFASKPDKAKDEKDTTKEIVPQPATTNAVFLLPVSDFENLLSTFEAPKKVEEGLYKIKVDSRQMLITSKDGYALLTSEDGRKSLELVLNSKTNITEELKPCQQWIDQQIVYCFLTRNGLQAYRGGEMSFMVQSTDFNDDFDEEIPEEIEKLIEEEEKKEALNEKDKKEESLFYDNTNYVAAGAKIDDSGVIRVTLRLSVKPDTPSSKILQDIEPSPQNPLAPLSQAPYIIAGNGPLWDKVMKMFTPITMEASTTPPNVSPLGTTPVYEQFHASVTSQSLLFGPPTKEQDILQNISVISWVVDSEKSFEAINHDLKKSIRQWLDGIEKGLQEVLDISKIVEDIAEEKDATEEKSDDNKEVEKKKPLLTVTAKETTIEGYKTLVITYDLSKLLEKLEDNTMGLHFVPMFEMMLCGKDQKVDEYNIQLDKHRILSVYTNDPQKLKQLVTIAQTKTGGINENPDVKKVFAMLPEQAQWKYLWNLSGTAKYFDWYFETLMTPMAQNFLPFDKLPEFPQSLPVGIAGTASPELLEMVLVLPPDTLRNAIQYGMQIQTLFQSFQPNNF